MIYIKYDYKLYTSEFHGTVVGTGNTQYKTPDRPENSQQAVLYNFKYMTEWYLKMTSWA